VVQHYLLERECYESLSSLLLETKIGLFESSTELSIFLQQVCLQGRFVFFLVVLSAIDLALFVSNRWTELTKLLKPLFEVYPNISKQVMLSYSLACLLLLFRLSFC
jgi:hypothetical protein